jgi:hypothetical protein
MSTTGRAIEHDDEVGALLRPFHESPLVDDLEAVVADVLIVNEVKVSVLESPFRSNSSRRYHSAASQ